MAGATVTVKLRATMIARALLAVIGNPAFLAMLLIAGGIVTIVVGVHHLAGYGWACIALGVQLAALGIAIVRGLAT